MPKKQHVDSKWDVSDFSSHQSGDVIRRNENIDKGCELCIRCEGTGNELFSMYRKCQDCNGTGRRKIVLKNGRVSLKRKKR